MRISVAMCTYNGACYLREQLASIAAQSLLPDELVVCDDGSTDGTVAMLEEFAASAPFAVRIVRNPANLGYGRNFVQAVQLCSGEVVALCDQDDVWYREKLARTVAGFEADPAADGFFSDGEMIGADSELLGRSLWASFAFGPEEVRRFNSGGAVDELLRRNVVTGMAFAFRSRVKGLLASLPESWIHDGWLAFLIAARSRLIACPERLVGYRVHGAQQVGAPVSLRGKIEWIREHGPGAYIAETHRRNLDEYQRTAAQFEDLARFLRGDGRADEGELIAQVEAKAEYARRGAAALSSARVARWGMLAGQVASYARFSPTGLRAIPRDLFV